jgi:hypothetical protein
LGIYTQYKVENHLIISALSLQQSEQFGGWGAWQFPIGEWAGGRSGPPGQAVGGFSSNVDLHGRILVRKNHSDYPATNVILKLWGIRIVD